MGPALTPDISGKWHQQPQGSALISHCFAFFRTQDVLTGCSKAGKQNPLDFVLGFLISWAKESNF